MASKKKHLREVEAFHKGKGYGCIWKHPVGIGSECHYLKNGYDAGQGRHDMYNKDHRTNAYASGYADTSQAGKFAATPLLGATISAAAGGRKDGALKKFKSKFQGVFYSAMHWLNLSERGWHMGYTLPLQHVPKSHLVKGPQPTFQIRDSGGYGAWYPFAHEHHHLVPAGALREHVIGHDDLWYRRVRMLVGAGWNINKQLNIVILPTEVFIGTVSELPAHCPWDAISHPQYSMALKEDLEGVRQQIDAAMDSKSCEDYKQVTVQLDTIAQGQLTKVKSMPGGSL